MENHSSGHHDHSCTYTVGYLVVQVDYTKAYITVWVYFELGLPVVGYWDGCVMCGQFGILGGNVFQWVCLTYQVMSDACKALLA